jgi:hypothetical protein
MVMSDLPSTTLAVLGLMLMAIGRGSAAALGAGALASALVWIRPTSVVLVLAGIAAYTARPGWQRHIVLYLAGAVPGIALLGAWQWATFGSPLTTGYQAIGASPDGGTALTSFFALPYAWQPPGWRVGADGEIDMDAHPLRWDLPNLVLYPLALLGADLFLTLPISGIIGLIAMARFSRQAGVAGVVGRYGLAALILTLALHLPYFFQAERYLMLPATVQNLCAAVVIGRWLGAHRPELAGFKRSPAVRDPSARNAWLYLSAGCTTLAFILGIMFLWLQATTPAGGVLWSSQLLHPISGLQQLMDRYGLE